MIILGLTGSIGMGKSTLAAMMQRMNIPVHNSDSAVHELLLPYSPAYIAITAAFPYYEFPKIYNSKTKQIQRSELSSLIFSDDKKREQLENILHPLVQQSQESFISQCRKRNEKYVCLDIPLLFETNTQKRVDYTIVVTAPPFLQRSRVLSRPNMNIEKLNAILARQLSDTEKCKRADYIIHTGLGLAHTLKSLKIALKDLDRKNCKLKEEPKINDPRNRPRY